MGLPSLAITKYNLIQPSSGDSIEFRPFLVKEEKVLLLALETGQEMEMIKALESVVDSCTFNKLDIKSLPLFDLEYMFLKIRAKSVGELTQCHVVCQDESCNQRNEINVNLDEIECTPKENHEKVINIDGTVGVVMKYPSLDMIENGEVNESINFSLNLIIKCIDKIFDGDMVYDPKDSTHEELMEFVESMDKNSFNKIGEFFETAPKMEKEIEFKCQKCDKENKILLEGIRDFFT